MTILFLSRLFYPHIGGVERHVLEVGKRLIKKGHRVIVITEEILSKDIPVYQLKDMSAKMTGEVEGIEIYRIPVGGENYYKKFRIWWWLWKHKDLIEKANIVHCHDVFFWYLPFRFIYPRKKVFTTFHGYEGNRIPIKRAIFMHKLAEKLSFGNICIGNYLIKWYGTKPNYVIYGAVEVPKVKKYKINVKDFINIVYVGRLEDEAGIMVYLKALKILNDKEYNIKFIVLGDGEQRARAEQFCNLNKLDVGFKGFVNNVFHYMIDADFVFTSRYLGILEAMVSKRIVFAVYNNPIKRDYLKMSPFAKWIIIESSPKNLADKIAYFIKHQDEKGKIVSTAYEWVKTQTWEKVVNVYLSLWRFNDLNH